MYNLKTKILLSSFAVSSLVIFSFLLTPASSSQIVFGPKTYTRNSGPPVIITDNFSATAGVQHKLVVINNDLQDSSSESTADSFIYLNGINIIGAHNFNQDTNVVEVLVDIQNENVLEVEVRGNEGGSFTVIIETVS